MQAPNNKLVWQVVNDPNKKICMVSRTLAMMRRPVIENHFFYSVVSIIYDIFP
jgi:hypothetical protein